jgi:hypothetical protein
MELCGECLMLESRLQAANNYYVSLILQQDRMVRDGNAEAKAFENAIEQAQGIRTSVTHDLLAHCTVHNVLASRLKTRTAGQL